MARKCIICNSSKDCYIFKEDALFGFPNYRCRKCNLIFLYGNDLELDKKCQEHYSRDYWSKFRIRGGPKRLLNLMIKVLRYLNTQSSLHTWHYNLMKKYLPKRNQMRLLDVGCGKGEALIHFHKMGYKIAGVEPDLNNTKKINAMFGKGVCINGLVEKVSIKDTYDIIYLAQVFEHIIRPDIFLNQIKKNLDQGIVFIEVPNCSSKKMLSISIDIHPHICHFTKKSIKKLFEKNGYKILHLDTYSEISHDYLSTFFKMLFKIPNYKKIPENKGQKIILIARKK